MIRPLILAIALLLPGFARAELPVFYSRENLTIHRQSLERLPWREGSADQEQSGITFNIEVRDAMTYYRQKDWFNLSGPGDDSGVLLVFSAPGLSPIIPSTQYAPLDILFVDASGKITQLLPNLQLSSLKEQILPKEPALAFLFLRGGLCQQLGIRPGDIIEYRMFSKTPGVIAGPVEPAQQQPVIIMQDEPRRKPMVLKAPTKNPAPTSTVPKLPAPQPSTQKPVAPATAQEKTAPVKTGTVQERVVK